MPTPRPHLNTDTVTRITQAVSSGSTREDAAAYAGVGRSTLHAWLAEARDLDKNPDGRPTTPTERQRLCLDLLDGVERGDGQIAVLMVGRVVAASATSWQAAAWWLERRRWADYGRKDFLRSEVTGRDGEPLESVSPRDVLADRLARLLPAEPEDEPEPEVAL